MPGGMQTGSMGTAGQEGEASMGDTASLRDPPSRGLSPGLARRWAGQGPAPCGQRWARQDVLNSSGEKASGSSGRDQVALGGTALTCHCVPWSLPHPGLSGPPLLPGNFQAVTPCHACTTAGPLPSSQKGLPSPIQQEPGPHPQPSLFCPAAGGAPGTGRQPPACLC